MFDLEIRFSCFYSANTATSHHNAMDERNAQSIELL
jgi:hypothetical protein